MIKVNQNSKNYVYMNCSRNKSLGSPVYLFSITNQYTQLQKRFIPANISFTANTENIDLVRYDKFEFDTFTGVTENFIWSDTTPVNLHLDAGMYYYKVYEQVSETNLNPAYSHDVVDEGILYVIVNNEEPPSYTGYSNNEIKVYES